MFHKSCQLFQGTHWAAQQNDCDWTRVNDKPMCIQHKTKNRFTQQKIYAPYQPTAMLEKLGENFVCLWRVCSSDMFLLNFAQNPFVKLYVLIVCGFFPTKSIILTGNSKGKTSIWVSQFIALNTFAAGISGTSAWWIDVCHKGNRSLFNLVSPLSCGPICKNSQCFL